MIGMYVNWNKGIWPELLTKLKKTNKQNPKQLHISLRPLSHLTEEETPSPVTEHEGWEPEVAITQRVQQHTEHQSFLINQSMAIMDPALLLRSALGTVPDSYGVQANLILLSR